MSYTPKYTSAAKVQGLTQFAADGSTSPTSTEILTWIQEVEADVDARFLYYYTATDQIIDVSPELGVPSKDTIAWLEAISSLDYDEISPSLLIPPFTPVVSVTSVYRRTTALTQTAAWEQLTEGPGSSASFMLLKRKTKTGQYLGFALYFYQNNPSAGLGRLKMTYVYGWNLSATILGEWCSLKVALKVLEAIKEATTPTGSGDYSIADLRVGLVDIETRAKGIMNRAEEIEEQYFPEKKLGLAFF